MTRTNSLPSSIPVGCASFDLSLAFHFVFRMMVIAIDFYWIFFPPYKHVHVINTNKIKSIPTWYDMKKYQVVVPTQ
jgi:hypothetical protein